MNDYLNEEKLYYLRVAKNPLGENKRNQTNHNLFLKGSYKFYCLITPLQLEQERLSPSYIVVRSSCLQDMTVLATKTSDN